MNIFVRTYATYGYDAADHLEVHETLTRLMTQLVSKHYGLSSGKQRVVHQLETHHYDFTSSLDMEIMIVFDDPQATSAKLTEFCQALRTQLHRRYSKDALGLKIIAITSPLGISVDRER